MIRAAKRGRGLQLEMVGGSGASRADLLAAIGTILAEFPEAKAVRIGLMLVRRATVQAGQRPSFSNFMPSRSSAAIDASNSASAVHSSSACESEDPGAIRS